MAVALVLASCAGTQSETKCCNPDWSRSVVYEFNTRQFTPEGTFAAAEEELPRLAELGIDIIWVMPCYPIGELNRKGTLGSYYAIRDYSNVNPEFGTLEDFDAFVEKAHELGMKVIIDWVANHTSPDHSWVTGKPADWYVRDENGNTVIQYDWTDIAQLNYANADMRAAMQEAMLFWLDRGIDGYRCDMAYIVPRDFWEPTIKLLREKAGKHLYFLAEGEEPWLHEAGFDATYSWKLHHLINDIAQGKAEESELDGYVKWNEENFPKDALRLVFTSNHDENSWSGTEFERMGDRMAELTEKMWNLPNVQPLIYTGQEIGYDHRFHFFEKDPVPAWKENNYTEFYRRLIDRKHTQPVERIEPPCWWIGMETPLQLLVQGENIGEYDVAIKGGKGVRVSSVEKAESPNYLFVNVAINDSAQPGEYKLVFSRGDESFCVPYDIEARREGSADRQGFNTSDLIYLIMPDRFSNGNPDNDNSPLMVEKADYKAFFGRHGGDLQGIRNHLDYLQDLGVTAIWCNPLLEDNEPESSYHGYACSDYYNIDPRFGTNDEYRVLVADAHAHGIKMISDVVTNHCGAAHWWMKDLPFSDWIHQWPEYTHSNCSFSTKNSPYCSDIDRKNMEEGWFDTSMPDMNLDNPYLLQYFKQWAVWLIEWADLDGFRVDTFPYNEKGPISEWCASVRKEYPNFNIVGEVWSNNIAQVAYWQDDNPNKDSYDSNLPTVMDFCLQAALSRFNVDYESWEEGTMGIYESIANDIYFRDVNNIMIFSGNHDIDRITDILQNDPRKVKLVMTLMATLRGIPQIYTGDEIMQVSRDRSQGHGGLRVEFDEDWMNKPAAVDVHEFTKTVMNWRKGSKAVQKGQTKHFINRNNTYAYFRTVPEESVFVFINNRPEDVSIPWEDYAEMSADLEGKTGVNVLTGVTFDPENCVVPAKTSLIVDFK